MHLLHLIMREQNLFGPFQPLLMFDIVLIWEPFVAYMNLQGRNLWIFWPWFSPPWIRKRVEVAFCILTTIEFCRQTRVKFVCEPVSLQDIARPRTRIEELKSGPKSVYPWGKKRDISSVYTARKSPVDVGWVSRNIHVMKSLHYC